MFLLNLSTFTINNDYLYILKIAEKISILEKNINNKIFILKKI